MLLIYINCFPHSCLSIPVYINLSSSHDFIGEFTTSYRELSRGQSQFNVYEVKYKNSKENKNCNLISK